MKFYSRRREIAARRTKVVARGGVVVSLLLALAWIVGTIALCLSLNSCQSKDSFDLMFDELANRQLLQMQAKTQQMLRTPQPIVAP